MTSEGADMRMQTSPDGCRGCDELARVSLSRRNLLKGLAAGAVALPAAGMLGTGVAYADPNATTWDGDTLVVLSLRGGFDGLSAVVPMHNDLYPDYERARPSIRVPQNKLVGLDGRFGLHPALGMLKSWYDSGKFGAVVAAGLPQPNRSHFEAMDEVEKGAPGSAVRNGWLNRVMGRHLCALVPLSAIQLGSNSMPPAFVGEQTALGMDSLESFTLDGVADKGEERFTAAHWRNALTKLSNRASAPVQAATGMTLQALTDIATVAKSNAGTGYPDSDTGRTLCDAARLIKSPMPVKLITLDVGDWDMHSDLGRHDGGWMRNNLTDLGSALAAFAADLGPRLDGVTLVTISEFGRRVLENESGGVDHGWGNVMFVLGGHVATGVKGQWPGLSKSALDAADGDVKATTDYRAVLAEILAKRCDADPADITNVFPGYRGTSSAYPGIISG